MNIPYMLGQSFGVALMLGTPTYYIWKGFFAFRISWPLVICLFYIPSGLLIFLSYPNEVVGGFWYSIVFLLLILGGITGAIKNYIRLRRSK